MQIFSEKALFINVYSTPIFANYLRTVTSNTQIIIALPNLKPARLLVGIDEQAMGSRAGLDTGLAVSRCPVVNRS